MPMSPRSCSPGRSAATSPRRAAVRIGLVPEVATLRIVSAGNVAGEGAKMALLSMRERAAAQALLEEVHYVELSDRRRLQRPLRRPPRLPLSPLRAGRGGGVRGDRPARRRRRRAPELARRRPPAAPAAAQPPGSHRRGGRAGAHPAATPLRPRRGGLRRLRHLRRPRRGLRPAGGPQAARRALLRRVRGRRALRRPARRRAGHVRAHRLPRDVVPPLGRRRARPRPLPRAARHLLRPLPARRLARPAPDRPAPRGGGAGGRAAGPAAGDGGGRRHRSSRRALEELVADAVTGPSAGAPSAC